MSRYSFAFEGTDLALRVGFSGELLLVDEQRKEVVAYLERSETLRLLIQFVNWEPIDNSTDPTRVIAKGKCPGCAEHLTVIERMACHDLKTEALEHPKPACDWYESLSSRQVNSLIRGAICANQLVTDPSYGALVFDHDCPGGCSGKLTLRESPDNDQWFCQLTHTDTPCAWFSALTEDDIRCLVSKAMKAGQPCDVN